MKRRLGPAVARPIIPVAVSAVLLALPSTAALADARSCTSATIRESFVLPDGTVHPGGKLTLCPGAGFTPVKSLSRTFVDRMPVGMFAGRREIVDRSEATPYYMIFDRSGGSMLRLSGFALPSGRGTEMYLLDQPARVDVEDSIGAGLSVPPGALRVAAAAD